MNCRGGDENDEDNDNVADNEDVVTLVAAVLASPARGRQGAEVLPGLVSLILVPKSCHRTTLDFIKKSFF